MMSSKLNPEYCPRLPARIKCVSLLLICNEYVPTYFYTVFPRTFFTYLLYVLLLLFFISVTILQSVNQ